MRFLLALLVLGTSALVQAPVLRRHGRMGELWAMLLLTAFTLVLFGVYEFKPGALQYPMMVLRSIFAPIGYWIVGY